MSQAIPVTEHSMDEAALEWKLLAEEFAERIEIALDGMPGVKARRIYTAPPYELGRVHSTLRESWLGVKIWPAFAIEIDGELAKEVPGDTRCPDPGVVIDSRGNHSRGGKICAYIVSGGRKIRGLITNERLVRERVEELVAAHRNGKALKKQKDRAREGASLVQFPGFESAIVQHRNGWTCIEGQSVHMENEENVVLWTFDITEKLGNRLRIRDLKGPMFQELRDAYLATKADLEKQYAENIFAMLGSPAI